MTLLGEGAVWKGHVCMCPGVYASEMHAAAAAIHAKPWMYVISMTYLLYQLPSANYASLRTTNAEFFDPKAMQLHTAYSMGCLRPG